mmetsp:Transcript_7711/g.34942  ORF Transcript_7711/g.34942 Transcript_7711/m.34942 type:complete len:290 (+) Transcript_7711:271-1140(+)
MADAVNFLIESGVSEAELYERAAIFTTREIQCVFRKRSRFEYLLRRRRIDISCYTNYIKFEINLIELLSLRKGHQEHNSALVHSVYRSLIGKVVVLYQRALRESKGSVGMWLRFATFCYIHGNRRLLSEVITQAIQMNPSCAGLWAFAAFWEYRSQGDVSAARRFFLRGLRNCSQAKVLWHEYFRLEVSHAINLATRWRLLGLMTLDAPRAEQGAAEKVFSAAILRHPDDVMFQLCFMAIALGIKRSTSSIVDDLEESIALSTPDTRKWRNLHREKCLSRVNINATFSL